MRSPLAAPSKHASSFSRGIGPPRFAFSLFKKRGVERRQALGCIGTRFKSGPVTQVRASPHGAAFAVRAPGDARLSALHRGGLLTPSPPWPHLRALHMSGALRCCIGAFARPARSSGRAVSPGRLPGVCLHEQTRGTPHPVLLKQCLAKAPSADGTRSRCHRSTMSQRKIACW